LLNDKSKKNIVGRMILQGGGIDP